MSEQNTPWLDKQRKIASRCEKEFGRPPKENHAYRVYGNVCVEEMVTPGGTTASDRMKAAARALRVDPATGERDLSATLEINAVEEEAASTPLDSIKVTLKQLPKVKVNHKSSLRYPKNPPINENSDYVAFQFYKYSPPFKQSEKTQGTTAGYEEGNLKSFTGYDYNQTASYTPNDDPTILLYMPEDVSTGFKANWGGKAFSTFAANSLRAAGGASTLDKLQGLGKTISEQGDKLVPLLGAAAIRKGIQKITGDSLSNNDVFGSISGVILNPNTELMFESIDMRNFQLTFKLMPRNQDESIDINKIVRQFKRTMLPRKSAGKVFGITNTGTTNGFISVPDLVRVAFMQGPNEHPHLPKFKMCAITAVDVNYTPDGNYATYQDGQPVAIELSLNFQETKLVFAEDIDQGIS